MRPLYSRLGIIALICAGLPAVRAGVVYQTGFEPPTFTTGTIDGQDGWFVSGLAARSAVETTLVNSGAQAVEIDRVDVSGVTGAGHVSAYDATGQVLTFAIDAYLASSAAPSYWTAIDSQYPASVADVNIDQAGEIRVFVSGIDHATGVFVTRGAWQHYGLTVDFTNDTVSAFYNGSPVIQGVAFSPGGNQLNLFAFYGQQLARDSAAFDNFSIVAGTVPEPGTWLGAVAGMLAIACGLRRRRATSVVSPN